MNREICCKRLSNAKAKDEHYKENGERVEHDIGNITATERSKKINIYIHTHTKRNIINRKQNRVTSCTVRDAAKQKENGSEGLEEE